MLHSLRNLNTKTLLLIATLLSGLFATIIHINQHYWLNVDSLLYFESARLMLSGQWQAAVNIYNWPFYAFTIAATSYLTHLDLHTAAQVLNVICFMITTWALGSIIRISGGNNLTILLAMLFLLGSDYISGSILPMLIRDQGFWAFFLLSIYFFIRFHRHHSLLDATLWQICIGITALFRFEGVIFMGILPFISLFQLNHSFKRRVMHLLKANYLLVSGLIFAALFILFVKPSLLAVANRATWYLPLSIWDELTLSYQGKLSTMAQLLGEDLDQFALSALMFGMIGIWLQKIISGVSIPLILVMVIYFLHKRPVLSIKSEAHQVLSWAFCINILLGAMWLFRVFVLSVRYLIPAGMIAIIYAAFMTEKVLNLQHGAKVKTWTSRSMLVMLLFYIACIIHNLWPEPKEMHFEFDAVKYLTEHHIPVEQVYFTTPISVFYAGLPYQRVCESKWSCIEADVQNGKAQQFNYLLIYLDRKNNIEQNEAVLKQALAGYSIMATFPGPGQRKKMVLYRKM